MRSLQSNIVISIFMLVLIAACAWPAFVAANFLLSTFTGEGYLIDSLQNEPKRKLLKEFIIGYKSSALLAAMLGMVAVIDFQLLSRNNLTGYIAGILVPVFCIALAFIFFPEPGLVLPSFAVTGVLLWLLYKFIDIGFRLRRVG